MSEPSRVVDLTAGPSVWRCLDGGDLVAELALGGRQLRLPLARLAAGSLLIGVEGGGGVQLEARLGPGGAVPLDGAWSHLPDMAAAADAWIGAMSAVIARLIAAPPHIDHAVAPGEIVRPAAGALIGVRGSAAWLLGPGDDLAMLGLAPEARVALAAPGIWVQTGSIGPVRAAATGFLRADGSLAGALSSVQAGLVAVLPSLMALAEVDRYQHETARRLRARALLDEARRRALGDAPAPAGHLAEDEPGVALVAPVAHRLGLPLRVPERQLRRTADQPHDSFDIAMASGFRLRRLGPDTAPIERSPLLPGRLAPVAPITTGPDPLALARFGLLAWPPRAAALRVRLALLDRLFRQSSDRLRALPPAALLDRFVALQADALEALGASWRALLGGSAFALATAIAVSDAGPGAIPAAVLLALLGGLDHAAHPASSGLDAVAYDLLSRVPKLHMIAGRERALRAWFASRPARPRSVLTPLLRAIRWAALGVSPLVGLAIGGGATALAALVAATWSGSWAVRAAITLVRSRSKPIPDWPDLPLRAAAIQAPLSGRIAGLGLSARQRNEDRLVFADLDITVEPGEFVALVGPPGSGKSTLLRILLGLEAPAGGAVFHDGHDLRGLDPATIARHAAAMLQTDRLGMGTIRQQLRLSSEIGEEAIWAVLDALGLGADLRALPAGLEARLPQGHRSLSQGQAQRLLLARALLAQPSLLVLDEPTSALDHGAERQVVSVLRRNPAARLVATHRPAIIAAADRVIDMGK